MLLRSTRPHEVYDWSSVVTDPFLMLTLGVGGLTLLILVQSRRAVVDRSRVLALLPSSITVSADTDQLIVDEGSGRNTVFLRYLYRIVDWHGDLCVFTYPDSALLVPRRAFASDEQFQAFRACLSRLVTKPSDA